MIIFLTDIKVREETIQVVAGLHDDSSYPAKMVPMGTLLTSKAYHSKLKVFKDGVYDYVISSGYVFPTLTNVNEDSDEVIIFEDDFNLLKLADNVLFDEDFTEVDSLLKDMIPEYHSKGFQDMCVSFSTTVDQIVDFNFKYDLHRTVSNDIKTVANKYNNDSKASTIVQTTLSTGNVTISMDNSESEIYIRVPSPTYNKFMMASDIYAGDTVSIYETHSALNTYKGIAQASHPQEYKDVLEEVGEENILGNPDNNYLPVQNNEKRFYAALCKFIDKSIAIYLEHNNSFSDTELERRIANNVIPTHTEIVLKSFIKAFVNVNWRHSNSVPLNEFLPERASAGSEDGEESEETADLSSDYYIEDSFVIGEGSDVSNYMVVIENFMKDRSLTAYAWAELIIKIARWGTRKPTAVAFVEEISGTGCTQILNLNNFTVQEDLSYLDDLEPYKYNGYDYMPLYLISTGRTGYMDASGYHKSLGYSPEQVIENTPIGIMCRQSFETNSGLKHRNVYFDFLTIIELYKSGDGSILGLDYYDDDNSFVVNEKLEETIEKGLHLNTIMKMLTKSHSDKDVIYPNPGIFKEMHEVKGFRIKDNPLDYTMYSMILNLISETKLSEVYRNVSKEDDPVKFVTKSLSKAMLNYIFIPHEHNLTIEDGLNNLNELYSGFEEIEVGGGYKSSIGRTTNFSNGFTGDNELIASIRFNLKNDVYYVVSSEEYKELGCTFKVVKGSEGIGIAEKDDIKVHDNISAYYTLAILVIQNNMNDRRSKVFIGSETIAELAPTYVKDHNMDIVKFVKTIQARMKQRKQ